MKEDLTKLIQEYKDYCDEETDKIAKDENDPRIGMSFTFDGFFTWLKGESIGHGQLPQPKTKSKKEDK